MLRALILTTSLIFAASALPAFADAAHPDPAPSKIVKKIPAQQIKDIKLPTQAELIKLQDNMPDMNAIMGQMMTVMKDPELRKGMEKSGKAFAKNLEESGALEPTGPDGMPDFNKAFGAMLGLLGDEEAMGGMLNTLGAMVEGLEGIEEHIPEGAKTTDKN